MQNNLVLRSKCHLRRMLKEFFPHKMTLLARIYWTANQSDPELFNAKFTETLLDRMWPDFPFKGTFSVEEICCFNCLFIRLIRRDFNSVRYENIHQLNCHPIALVITGNHGCLNGIGQTEVLNWCRELVMELYSSRRCIGPSRKLFCLC